MKLLDTAGFLNVLAADVTSLTDNLQGGGAKLIPTFIGAAKNLHCSSEHLFDYISMSKNQVSDLSEAEAKEWPSLIEAATDKIHRVEKELHTAMTAQMLSLQAKSPCHAPTYEEKQALVRTNAPRKLTRLLASINNIQKQAAISRELALDDGGEHVVPLADSAEEDTLINPVSAGPTQILQRSGEDNDDNAMDLT